MSDELNGVYQTASRGAWAMLWLNLLLCISKLMIGWFGGSFALISDGLNNFADVGISAALLFGMRVAQRPPDAEHAYGHGKFEQETARLISTFVLVTGGGIIVGGINRLGETHDPPSALVLVMAVVAIGIKFGMYRYQSRLAKRLASEALAADALNHKTDMGATACVFVGTVAIWVGGPSWALADDVAAVVIGGLMAVAAGQAIWATSSELLDRMPPLELVNQIRILSENFPRVMGVDKVLGRKTGMHYLIDIHLEVPGDMTVDEAHQLGHQVKDWLMTEMPEILDLIVHLEPAPISAERPNPPSC
ncbi:MAG: cation diffusion facilitator family transporter [Candidatus Latescibacteria bacterium]|nr:cation diffusion facilitator family transporter [Candidatus Latescibacterota bacterium]